MILRVDVGTGEIKKEPVPFELELYGGRGFIAQILKQEVPPTSNPLSRHNKLVITTGLLAGSLVSGANRLSIGCKSPLTGGVKECNSGGKVAFLLGRLGIRAIIIEGIPQKDKWHVLKIDSCGTEICDGSELLGLGIHAKTAKLRESFGRSYGSILIGPAGEQLLNSAGIAVTDTEGRPSRFAARGGIGAVMGSKHVHAVLVEESSSVAGKGLGKGGDHLGALARELNHCIAENPITGQVYPNYGTSSIVDITNALGGLPTRNFQRGSFNQASNINAETLRRTILKRGGEGNPTHACMPGCTVRCSNVFPDKNGHELVSPLEYETISLLGSNLCIGDLDAIASLNSVCNDLGMDTIEVGGALGVLMEAGILGFGNVNGALFFLKQIAAGNLTGRLLGAGAEEVGKVLGIERVPAVKGQTMAGYEPRAIKGLGVTYATSPMGADHTAGNMIRAQINHHSSEGKILASLQAQQNAAFFDNLGVCLFVTGAMAHRKEFWAEAVSAYSGRSVSLDELDDVARNVLKLEGEFNRKAGITVNALPEWCYEEINPDSGTVFDISVEELCAVWD